MDELTNQVNKLSIGGDNVQLEDHGTYYLDMNKSFTFDPQLISALTNVFTFIASHLEDFEDIFQKHPHLEPIIKDALKLLPVTDKPIYRRDSRCFHYLWEGPHIDDKGTTYDITIMHSDWNHGSDYNGYSEQDDCLGTQDVYAYFFHARHFCLTIARFTPVSKEEDVDFS